MDLRQVQSALLAAFNGEELRQLAAIELGVDLERVVHDGGTLAQRVLDLAEWAVRQNRLAELLCGAYNRNGNNPQMAALVDQAVRWPECVEAGMVVQDGRASCFAPRVKELAYLDELLADYEAWANLYTPLPGDVEAPVGGRRAPKLLAPDSFLPQEFDAVATHEFGAQTETKREAVDDLRKAVAQHNRLVVLGDPGSGKTTTLQMLRREYAQAAKADNHAPLPVLVTLGGYTGAETPMEYIMRSAGSLGPHLLAYLKAGRAVLLLDALNEMPQHDYRERVKRIKALLDRFRDAPVLVTCRALNYIEELNLRKLQIRPLDEQRQMEYLRRYLGDEEGDALFWRLAGGPDVAALWATWEKAGGAWEDFWRAEKMPDEVYKATSISQDGLWHDLRSGKLAGMLALSVNPYMLAMLIKVYVEGAGVLPQNRAQLFDAFVRVLLARERRRADSRDWPGDEPLRTALSQLAYAIQSTRKRGTSVDLDWAASQLAVPGLSADAALYWARSATLLESLGDSVRFVHQLVQEYFAATRWQQWIAEGGNLSAFMTYGWDETAILLAGMLSDTTELVRALTRFQPVLAARCVAESGSTRHDVATIEDLQRKLVAEATHPTGYSEKRKLTGNALNLVGDPRPGVGLRPDGLPDIMWCRVPAGEFLMGSIENADNWVQEDAMPQHHVTLPAFCIAKYPVTNSQYQTFVDDGGYTSKWQQCWTKAGWDWRTRQSVTSPNRYGGDFDLPNHPVVGVSWYEAVAFCNWLSVRLGRPVRLPGEAEWEKAARCVDGRLYPWGYDSVTSEHANFESTGIGCTSAVGVFPKGETSYGLLDALGNVSEWTNSKYAQYPYTLDDAREDQDGEDTRALRGGSWFNYEVGLRCAFRDWGYPGLGDNSIGFRLASLALE